MEAFYRVRCKENEVVPEWAGLLTAKSKDPLDKAELRALNAQEQEAGAGFQEARAFWQQDSQGKVCLPHVWGGDVGQCRCWQPL